MRGKGINNPTPSEKASAPLAFDKIKSPKIKDKRQIRNIKNFCHMVVSAY